MREVFQAAIAASGLLVFHAPDGHKVYVNPDEITLLHQRMAPGEKRFTEGASCMINLTDGKFVTVVEPCMAVVNAIQGSR